MNKITFAILFFLVFSCKSQDSKDINIDTRKEIENWLNQKLNEPCYFIGSPKGFEPFKKQKVGSVSNKVILKTFLNNDFTLSIEIDFIIGENDCVQHRMWLFSKKGSEKIDSLLVDYLGDSFGIIDINSRIQAAKRGVDIYFKEKEILTNFETAQKTERKKTILFSLNTDGFFENKNNDEITVINSGRLFSIGEYLSDFKNNYKYENKNFIKINEKQFIFIQIRRLNSSINDVLIFSNNNKKYFSYIASFGEFSNESMRINKISKYNNEIYLDIINKNKLNKVYYFQYSNQNKFCLEKIISKSKGNLETVEQIKQGNCINFFQINNLVNK